MPELRRSYRAGGGIVRPVVAGRSWRASGISRLDHETRALANRVASDVARISGAVALAHVAALAAAPLITRLYGPEAFGHFALFNAIVTIVTPLISLRYEWALPLPAEERSALELLALCMLSVLTSSLVLAAAGSALWPLLGAWSGSGVELAFVPAAVLALGFHGVLRNWLVREQAFAQVARMRFVTIVGTMLCQIGLGLHHGSSVSLVLGMIGGYTIGLSLACYQCRTALQRMGTSMRLSRIRRVVIEYRQFAIITAPSGVVNAIGSQLPSLVFPALYGLPVAGQFSLARQVLSQPLTFIGQAANEVLWGKTAQLLSENPARLWPLFVQMNWCLFGLMVPGLLLVWFGAELFAFVFGPDWARAGSFAGVMVVASFFGLAAQGTTSLHVYRLNHWMCAWEFFQLGLTLTVLGAAMQLSWSAMSCVVALTVGYSIAHIVLLVLNGVAVRRTRSPLRGGAAAEPTR
jgi:O-antigen/teichoic acid export membrane protein